MRMTTEITVLQWLKDASLILYKKTDSPLSDARVILSRQLNVNTTWLAAHPDSVLDSGCLSELQEKLDQLVSGVPLPYVIQHWEFFGLDFYVTPAVLIPRPETEILVELALSWLDEHPQVSKAFDVGTGTGCISVALAHHKSRLHIIAIDKSETALEVARINIDRHHLSDRITLVQSDMLTGIRDEYIQLLCANLPYIQTSDLVDLPVSRHEPIAALDGGEDGMDYHRILLRQAKPLLMAPYYILLEMEYRQAEKLMKIAAETLPGSMSHIVKDISGLSRVICIESE